MDTRYLREDQIAAQEMKKEFGENCFDIPIDQIEVDKPDAFPGDTVLFNNYRMKEGMYSQRKVIHLETHWISPQKYRHVYYVKPENKTYKVVVREVTLIQP